MTTQESTPVNANPAASDSEAQRSFTQRAASKAHATIDSAAVKAEELEVQLRAEGVKASSKIDASQEAATEQVEQSLVKLRSFIKGRPVAAAGIAFAAGVLATVLLRR